MPRTYELMIPAPAKWISANDRRHRYSQATVVRTWRQAAYTYARKAGLPRGLERVRIAAVLHFPTRRGRDNANYQATLKPIVDGLGPDRTRITKAGKKVFAPGWGLINDDTPAHLDGPHITISPYPVAAPGYVVVTITDLSEEVALVGRIRTIKPDFFRSRSLAKCSREARMTFAGLWTEADDHGRGVADARILKGAIWPLDDDVTHSHVSAHLDMLAATGHIRLYEVGDETYFEVVKWAEHQAAAYRRGDAKYPGPDAGHSVSCDDVQESAARDETSAGKEGKGKEGKGKERSASTASHTMLDGLDADASSSKRVEPGSDQDPDFVEFWKTYPRKSAKDGARKSWRSAIKRASPADIIAGAKRYRDDPRRKPDYTAHPTTWLNQGRWADEYATTRAGAAAAVATDFSDWKPES